MVGLGRSGLILRMFAMRLMQIGFQAHVVGDVTTPAIEPKDLLIALSGSGATESVVNLARKAKNLGASVLAITSNPGSPLAQLADQTVILPAESVKLNVATPTQLPLANALEQAMILYLDCLGRDVGCPQRPEQHRHDATPRQSRVASLSVVICAHPRKSAFPWPCPIATFQVEQGGR